MRGGRPEGRSETVCGGVEAAQETQHHPAWDHGGQAQPGAAGGVAMETRRDPKEAVVLREKVLLASRNLPRCKAQLPPAELQLSRSHVLGATSAHLPHPTGWGSPLGTSPGLCVFQNVPLLELD